MLFYHISYYTISFSTAFSLSVGIPILILSKVSTVQLVMFSILKPDSDVWFVQIDVLVESVDNNIYNNTIKYYT